MSSPLRYRLAAISAALCALSLALVVASCSSQRSTPTEPAVAVNADQTDAKGGATQQCSAGGITDERAPYAVTAPEGEVVTGVCVKAGTQMISVSTTNACYTVSGLGSTTATVTKTGTGSNCKDISYATFYTASPTPTPTATPTATPTDTPTPTTTATPTDTPTPTTTATPTDTPTPTPTATPTNTPTDTPTPTPTNTPTNTPTPTPTTPTPIPLSLTATADRAS